MTTLSPYLTGPAPSLQHMLSNSPALLMLPRLSSDDLGVHFDETDFQSNHLDSGRWSSNLSGLGIRNLDFSKDLQSHSFSQDIPHGSQARVNLDRRYGRRMPRMESTYDTLNESLDSFIEPLDNASSLPSAWSFSSVIKAAELAADEAVYEMHSELSLEFGLADPGPASNILDTGDQIPWAFDESFNPGDFVSEFIAQLKQTAILSETGSDTTSQAVQTQGDGQTQTTYSFHEQHLIESGMTEFIPELSLPVVGLGMRDVDLENPCIGVNPADILRVLPSPPSLSNVPLYFSYLNVSLSTNQPVVDGEDSLANVDCLGLQTAATYQASHDVVLPGPDCVDSKTSKQASDEEHSVFHSPTCSDYSPSFNSPVLKQTFSIRGKKRRVSRTKAVDESDFIYPETHNDYQYQAQDLPLNLGTPVLDAHRGVELEELKAKAERYRLRNQGRDYDKRWLISFAGKLSVRGELVEEFRCYITGCQQMNKRRDHILIHVGAHLDQRPFKCCHCSSRFLRKNECKRHELSHTGIRPYSCHLCPLPATTFVRQDLLKRHMKRTHRLDLEKGDKENNDTYRPRKKARV